MNTTISEHEGILPRDRVTVNVMSLQYRPSSKAVQWCVDTVKKVLPPGLAKPITYFVHEVSTTEMFL
jgi:hypothetical protein